MNIERGTTDGKEEFFEASVSERCYGDFPRELWSSAPALHLQPRRLQRRRQSQLRNLRR